MSEVTNNVDTESYDAQQAAEEIAAGDEKAPSANVEADYEASKQFSTSSIDETEEGAKAAAAATAPQHDLPKKDTSTQSAESTGNPDDFRQLAHDVSSAPEGAGNVDDALVQKGLEKGQAAQ